MIPQLMVNDKILSVKVEKNIEFISKAKTLGGKWSFITKSWDFDVRNEVLIRQVVLDIFGTDGHFSPEKVSIRAAFKSQVKSKGPITLGGKIIAVASGNSGTPKLGPNVILESGSFESGGSYANWKTLSIDAVVLIHDFPKNVAEGLIKKYPSMVSIIETSKTLIDLSQIISERDRLQARLIEIEKILMG